MKTIEIRNNNQKIYEICIDHSYDSFVEKMIGLGAKERKICIITDSNVAPLYLESIEAECAKFASKVVHFIFKAGEEHKNLSTIEEIYKLLIEEKFDRKDFMVALGGGVTGDMTGYAAATYLRGISFVQVPTSLLAQVDSSIGGKTGVDFLKYKNMVGAFHQPALVYMNLTTLNTLEDRQLSAGMAEVIKHGLIKNKEYFNWILENADQILERNYDTLEHMIYESCLIKGAVVEKDPTEKGERALLNFGHTVGHAVEKLKDFELLHGECVALGAIAASKISFDRGLLTEIDFVHIKDAFKAFHLAIETDRLDQAEVLETTKSDKKMDAGKVRFILLDGIGNGFIEPNVTDKEILRSIEVICQ